MPEDVVLKRWEANAESWTALARAGYDVYRDALNTPAFLAFLPTVTGLKGLDIGCGEAENTRTLARQGAVMSGVHFAPTFIHYAHADEQDAPLNIEMRL